MNWAKPISLMVAAVVVMPAMAGDVDTVSKGAVTFTKDVLPILQENCQDCHRSNGANLGGMVAPMSFTSYEDTRPWAKAISKAVSSRNMPPWDASHDFLGVFRNERVLSEEEIETIVAWVDGGAPRGNPEDAPAPREFPETGGWQIGEPDLIISMPERYFVEDDVRDIYVNFYADVTEEMLPEARWIKAIEFRPGSPVVHHIISDPLGGIAPGNDPTVFDDGYGRLLRPGSKVSFEMHYHKEPGPGTGVWDQSVAALKFYPKGEEPEHEIRFAFLANFDFEIPPGDPNFEATSFEEFNRDVQILSYTPHMHLRGKSANYVAEFPDGKIETLLDVPQYDFNWQTTYWYKEPKILPAGSKMKLTAAWDNSPDNPSNPDPTQTVRFGEPTTDEMMFGFVQYAFVEEPEGLSIELLEAYTGEYTVGPGMKLEIGGFNGQLFAEFSGREIPLTYVSDTEFSFSAADVLITFVRDESGAVNTLKVKMGGQVHEAKRVVETQDVAAVSGD